MFGRLYEKKNSEDISKKKYFITIHLEIKKSIKNKESG